ncbi:MAG: hypothetical protein ROO71_12755 [Balneola sp.]
MGRDSNKWIDDGLDVFASSHTAQTSANWISQIQDAIKSSNLEIDNVLGSYSNNSIGQLGGFYAEAYHPGSFNINAAKNQSSFNTFREGSTANGSSDIGTSWGEKYGAKYNNTHQRSLGRQAEVSSNQEGTSKYSGQERLIPSDQLTDAQKAARDKVAKELSEENAETAARYKETGDRLTDRLRAPDGTESKPLTKPDADQWAKDAKNGNVRHFEIQNEVLLREHLTQIGKAAGGAAAISVAIQAAPIIVSGINKLVRNQDYTASAFGREVGTWAKEQGGAIALDTFTKASLGGALSTAQQLGHLSGPLASASPATLGGIAVVSVESIKALWAWQNETCTGEQALSQSFVCGAKTAVALQGAAIGQTIIPIPVVGAIVGSLAGSFLAEQGMQSMSNTTTITLLQELDKNFALHQKHVKILATSSGEYKEISNKYDNYLAKGTFLLVSAEIHEEENEQVLNDLENVEELSESSIEQAQKRLDLWRGNDV